MSAIFLVNISSHIWNYYPKTIYHIERHIEPVLKIRVVSSNPAHCEEYSTQHYIIKFVSDFRQVGGFLRYPPPIKLIDTI